MTFLPLAQLFRAGRRPEHPVAWSAGAARTWGEFAAASAGVAAQARTLGGEPGAGSAERWVLACEDAWAFAAGFSGLLQAGRTVVVPPNFLPETLARFPGHRLLRNLPAPAEARPEAGILEGRVEFWTSGTTGEPKALVKTLAQLDAEVAVLEALFGARLTGGLVVGTLPHQHIYGCLFRVLWPLAAGRPLLSEPCGDPASFLRALATMPAPALISSPAHLARLPRLLDLEGLPRPAVIFSSGGPLEAADAAQWAGGVVEIYGSTETGGIAWRQQDGTPEAAFWTPFPDVALSCDPDGALVVAGFRAGPAPQRMEDAAEPMAGGRFRLLGRLDRTLKLEEKRVSLPELEAALQAHPLVARAAVALLPGPRPRLGAVVVLRDGAATAGAGRELRRHLAGRFEAVALPRRWRFVAELPYDGRGKLTAQALTALFGEARP